MPTKIEWTDVTWNPVTGCTKVSPGCANCYAERMAMRLQKMGQPKYANGFNVTLHPKELDKPLHWKKPRNIFVCSMSDLFHEDVPFEFFCKVWEVMRSCPQHDFQILTKRPLLMRKQFWKLDKPPLPNVWLGVTAEDQQRADERITILLDMPAAVHFLSLEPLLGPMDLSSWFGPYFCDGHGCAYIGDEQGPEVCTRCGEIPDADDRCECKEEHQGFTEVTCPKCGSDNFGSYETGSKRFAMPDWVIVGGESGPNARPLHPDWVRSIRDQCKAAGVAFFFKQWGEYAEGEPRVDCDHMIVHPDGESFSYSPWNAEDCDGTEAAMFRVGKKAAGRLLDGKEHNEYPEPRGVQGGSQ